MGLGKRMRVAREEELMKRLKKASTRDQGPSREIAGITSVVHERCTLSNVRCKLEC